VTHILRSSLALASLLVALTSSSAAAAQTVDAGATGREVTAIACVTNQRDFVRTSDAGASASGQLLLVDVTSGIPTYSITGVREAALAAYVGRRVAITGTIERARTTPLVTTADGARAGAVATTEAGAAGVTPEGASAHEAADALTASVRTGAVDDPALHSADPASRIATLPRLNASGFRSVEGGCPPPPRPSTQASASADITAPTPGAPLAQARDDAPRAQQLIVRGCLARQTATGTALTPQQDSQDRLVLTNAVSTILQPHEVRSAVPASSPGGSGSGTVPQPAGTSGRTSSSATPVTYALVTSVASRRELTPYVGERVEIAGTTQDAGTPPPSPATAHPSAPTREITVTSFRALGGACQ